jgi:hypothetical protein
MQQLCHLYVRVHLHTPRDSGSAALAHLERLTNLQTFFFNVSILCSVSRCQWGRDVVQKALKAVGALAALAPGACQSRGFLLHNTLPCRLPHLITSTKSRSGCCDVNWLPMMSCSLILNKVLAWVHALRPRTACETQHSAFWTAPYTKRRLGNTKQRLDLSQFHKRRPRKGCLSCT